ncbi:helix-turn-helix transcriptional regulator [Brevibacillus laterosporus]|uniref:helix-turn-helix domain-containing protein n=1 Tax=Brevibacillus laterosporus TaxID=1465 RepID=UPI003D2439BD
MIKCHLSKICGERRLKITKIAEDTGISRTTLTAIYYEKGKSVTFEVMDKLCKYLKVSLHELFEHIED